MKIGVLGSGNVGAPLADRLQRLGHDVTIGARAAGSGSLDRLLQRNPRLVGGSMADAVRGAEVIFLALPFAAAVEVLESLADLLAGRVIVDCTNPIGAGLSHGLESRQSGAGRIQSLVPGAHVVKAFNMYGAENFEDNRFAHANVLPAMMICGDDAAAKAAVSELVGQLGFESVDTGGLVQALHLEHLALLWIRMVRVYGHAPHLTWAVLRRSA